MAEIFEIDEPHPQCIKIKRPRFLVVLYASLTLFLLPFGVIALFAGPLYIGIALISLWLIITAIRVWLKRWGYLRFDFRSGQILHWGRQIGKTDEMVYVQIRRIHGSGKILSVKMQDGTKIGLGVGIDSAAKFIAKQSNVPLREVG